MKLVIIESPFFNKNPNIIKYNVLYAKLCMKDSLDKNEAPFLSHLLYTSVLDDNIPFERNFGINAGLEWGKVADKTVVYLDLGISQGMEYGIENAKLNSRPIEYRYLPEDVFTTFNETNKNLLSNNM